MREPPESQVFSAVFFCRPIYSILGLVGSEGVKLDPGGQSPGQSGEGERVSNPEPDSCGGWPGGIDVSIVDLEKGK